MSRSVPVPTPRAVLDYIAANEPLDHTCAHFGLSREQVGDLLSGGSKGRKNAPGARASSLNRMLLFCDGASRGNPGLAGGGAVLKDPSGTVIARLGKFLGETTNNVAEYEGLLLGLREARKLGAREIDVAADSELLVRQMKGEYKIKNAALRKLAERAFGLLGEFDRWSIRHVYREENGEADEMSNRAIDERM